MPKLPIWILKNIDRKKIKEVIKSWNKENFRNLLFQILDNWWDVNEVMNLMKEFSPDVERYFLEVFFKLAIEESKNKW